MPKGLNEKRKKSLTDYSFEDLDSDLIQLDELLNESKVKIEDRRELIKPLTCRILKTSEKLEIFKRATLISWLPKIAFFTLVFLLTIFFLVQHWEYFYWHISAVSRIIMIKVLPYFDWRYLKNEACLIPSFTNSKDTTAPSVESEVFDCDLCESLRDFEYFQNPSDKAVSQEFIMKFVEVDKPLIIKGEIEHWIKDSPTDFVEQMLDKKDFSRSIPCNLYSNIHNSRRGEVDLMTLFQKKDFFDSFFMHFQNCDPRAMRVFRNFTYRPPSLPDELSPVSYNWLLWNKNYSAMRYKKIYLIERHTAIGQIFGSTRLRLIPRKNCQDVCPILEGILPAGYFLVLTSLWDVEYLPEGEGEHMAAILELKG